MAPAIYTVEQLYLKGHMTLNLALLLPCSMSCTTFDQIVYIARLLAYEYQGDVRHSAFDFSIQLQDCVHRPTAWTFPQ